MTKLFTLPPSRPEKKLRSEFSDKRVSLKTPKYLTGAVDHILGDVLDAIKQEVDADPTRTRATLTDLVNATRGPPELSRIFQHHTVCSGTTRHKYNPEDLLTKADISKRRMVQEKAKKAREQAKVLKEAEADKAAEEAVPPVDED